MTDDIYLIYIIVVVIIYSIFKFYRPFRTNYKLQRFSPLFVIFIAVIHLFTNIHINTSKPFPYILAILLIILSIWGVIKNFRVAKGNTDPE